MPVISRDNYAHERILYRMLLVLMGLKVSCDAVPVVGSKMEYNFDSVDGIVYDPVFS